MPTQPPRVCFIANARIPGERAQSIQTVRTAAALARAGARVRLLYARRRVRRAVAGADARNPLAYYGIDAGAHPTLELESVPVVDAIELVPRALQALPARIEEWTFGRNAARMALADRDAWVYCREIEVGARLAAARHPRYVFEAHSIPGHPVRRRWAAAALRGAAEIVTITAGLADDLAAEFSVERAKISIIPDAYEAADFGALPDARAARAALGIGEGAPLVVYAGHLFAWKGVDVLVEAARRAPSLRFLFVGGLPEDAARLRALAAGLAHVEILGHKPPREVPEYLAAADVVAIPNSAKQAISARHTSPLKVFEAMAAGRAIVASDLPSLREVLVPDGNARLVPPDDPVALAGALVELAADEPLRRRLAAQARADAARYTFDARARAILGLVAGRG